MTAPDRRELLLNAAMALFAERPFDAVSVADIAQQAGVAFGLVAHYFGSKRGIYVAAMRETAEQLRSARDQPPPAGDDVAEVLRKAITRHIAYLESRAQGFRILMHCGMGADEEVRQIMTGLRWEGAERVMTVLQVKRPITPALHAAMHGWVGFLDEAVLAWLEKKGMSRQQLASLVIAMLAASLRAVMAIDPDSGINPRDIRKLESR